MQPLERKHPYVVIRWMSAVYGVRCVRFVADEDPAAGDNELQVPFRGDPVGEAGELTASARQALVEVVSNIVAKTGRRMCVVFSPTDSCYCEPDGCVRNSASPPSGGLRLDRVEVADG